MDLDYYLTPAIRAARHRRLSYFYGALMQHQKHGSFEVRDWPSNLELGFICGCSGTIREWRISIRSLKEELPEAREAFLRFRDNRMRHGNKARKREQQRAEHKAKSLLYRFLSREQKWELKATGAFTVKGGDDRVYQVGVQGTHLLEDGQRCYSFCLVPAEKIPKHDRMLAHKVLLEADPNTFLRKAHVEDLKLQRKFNSGAFLAERIEPPAPDEVYDDVSVTPPLPNEVLDEPLEWVHQQMRSVT